MKDSGKPGQNLANVASVLLAAGCVFLGVTIGIGVVGISGAFVHATGVATTAMVVLLGVGVAFLAAGLNRRRAARIAGWSPARETAAKQAAVSQMDQDDKGTCEGLSQAKNAGPDDEEAQSAHIPVSHHAILVPGNTEDDIQNNPNDVSSNDDLKGPSTSAEDETKADYLSNVFSNFPGKANVVTSETIPRHIARKRLETVERMLLRAEDIFAAARDLTTSGRTVDAFADLSTMLAASDALKLSDPPRLKPIRLSRNGRYWLGGDVAEASDETFDAVVSLEAAFNICHDMITYEGEHPSELANRSTFDKARHALAATSKVKPDYTTRSDALDLTYPASDLGQPLGEWELRMNVANAAENAGLPFRLTFDMKTNAAEKLVLVRLQVPRPTCFSIVAEDETQREALARDYAYRSALFMAKAALGGPEPSRSADLVVVVCFPRSETEAVLSMEATREDLPSLQAIARCEAPILDFSHPNVHMSWEHDWLDPVDAHLEADDPLFSPERYAEHIELSSRPFDEKTAHATGAQRECDLGTIEGVAMQRAWTILDGRLSGTLPTVGNAVAVARELQESTEDPSIREACSRIMRALVDGVAEPDQVEQLETIFKGQDALVEALSYGAAAFVSRQAPEMEKAVTKLSSALSPTMQIELMDDTESVFRHFRNTAERVSYNLHFADKRHVHMVPRAYYAANEMTAHLLCLLNRPDEAESYVDEIVRLAPLSASAIATKARVLEELSRMFEAIDLMNDAILDAPTVHDAALCYYRMAYLQWRTGRHDVAAATYRASISMRTDIGFQAQKELDELLESDSDLQDCSEDDAFAIMEAGGVNIWPREERREEIAKAAVLCADQQVYPAAHQLGLALLEFRHDDALIDVCRSFVAE
ncbi:MAG: hypothetical protein J5804_01325 [Eggerthellaceae bacterium]|nr:hypothetical protein [Eggerthellaceae bacterium]